MKANPWSLLAAVFAASLVPGSCVSPGGGEADRGGSDRGGSSAAACLCDQGKAGENVWCPACKVGYIDGKKITCEECHAKMMKE
jgi:hypothetical protein